MHRLDFLFVCLFSPYMRRPSIGQQPHRLKSLCTFRLFCFILYCVQLIPTILLMFTTIKMTAAKLKGPFSFFKNHNVLLVYLSLTSLLGLCYVLLPLFLICFAFIYFAFICYADTYYAMLCLLDPFHQHWSATPLQTPAAHCHPFQLNPPTFNAFQ
jgi:hypothetical protein